jgi:hypothetical protein
MALRPILASVLPTSTIAKQENNGSCVGDYGTVSLKEVSKSIIDTYKTCYSIYTSLGCHSLSRSHFALHNQFPDRYFRSLCDVVACTLAVGVLLMQLEAYCPLTHIVKNDVEFSRASSRMLNQSLLGLQIKF